MAALSVFNTPERASTTSSFSTPGTEGTVEEVNTEHLFKHNNMNRLAALEEEEARLISIVHLYDTVINILQESIDILKPFGDINTQLFAYALKNTSNSSSLNLNRRRRLREIETKFGELETPKALLEEHRKMLEEIDSLLKENKYVLYNSLNQKGAGLFDIAPENEVPNGKRTYSLLKSSIFVGNVNLLKNLQANLFYSRRRTAANEMIHNIKGRTNSVGTRNGKNLFKKGILPSNLNMILPPSIRRVKNPYSEEPSFSLPLSRSTTNSSNPQSLSPKLVGGSRYTKKTKSHAKKIKRTHKKTQKRTSST